MNKPKRTRLPTDVNQSAPAPGTNNLAITSMVIGIVSIVIPFLPLIPPILSIIFGGVALKQINNSGEQGKGMAIAGIIMGVVSVVVTLLFAAIILFGVMTAVDTYERLEPIQDVQVQFNQGNCELGLGFGCKQAAMNNGLLTVTIQNTENTPQTDLTLQVVGTDGCLAVQPVGDLQVGEERTVVFPCTGSTFDGQMTISSNGINQATGQISIN